MSPLWPNHLFVWLSANGVAVVKQQAGLRKKVLEQNASNIEGVDQNIAYAWQAAINTLSALLSNMQLAANTKLTVTVASDFVRYLSLPAQHIAMRRDEKLAYAAAAYRELYGEQAAEWQVQCDDPPPHHTTLAAAMDADLLMAIKQIAEQHTLKLQSVQPYLMAAINGLYPQIAKANGYLAIVEERLLLLSLSDGQYQSVKTYALDAAWHTELCQIAARESLLSNNEHHQLLVYAPQFKSAALAQLAGWQISRIGLANIPQGYSEQAFAMLEVLA